MKVYVIYNRAERPLAYVKASSHCIATKKAVSRYGAGVCVEYNRKVKTNPTNQQQ